MCVYEEVRKRRTSGRERVCVRRKTEWCVCVEEEATSEGVSVWWRVRLKEGERESVCVCWEEGKRGESE